MALTKETKIDKIEIVGDFNVVQVRQLIRILEDGNEIGRDYHRYSINPTDDISNETDQVKAICVAVHTQEIKDAYTAHMNRTYPDDLPE